MDNITHALAGALIAAGSIAMHDPRALRRGRPAFSGGARTAATIAGVVAAELPDADLLYAGANMGMGKLGYLLHHRGHTHSVLFALLAGALVWGVTLAFRRELREPGARGTLLAIALAGTLSHLALDFTNSYGIHPFWPVVNRWFYGDAVFIVEPWLFVIAIPALVLLTSSRITRGILSLLLAAMLIAAWSIGAVDRGVAIALTLGAVAWSHTMWSAHASRRAPYALLAWLGVEVAFFAASSAARRTVRDVVGAEAYRDAVLTPAVGDPFCVNAIVVELDATIYRASAATVATVPGVRSAARCARGAGTGPSARAGTPALRWGGQFSAPVRALRELVATNCEIAAAMQFIRVPVWRRAAGDSVEFADLRYRDGGGGFATIMTARTPARCPDRVPGWVPPRSDLLGE